MLRASPVLCPAWCVPRCCTRGYTGPHRLTSASLTRARASKPGLPAAAEPSGSASPLRGECLLCLRLLGPGRHVGGEQGVTRMDAVDTAVRRLVGLDTLLQVVNRLQQSLPH